MQRVYFRFPFTEEQDGSPNCDGGAITSYTGLSATTQERIRRFEQETLAMLHKEYKLNKDKDVEKDRLARDLSQTKRELEMDDKSLDSSTQCESLANRYA